MKSYKIIQIPSSENAFIAIVQGEIQTKEGVISDFGIATKKAEKTDDVEKLLEIAREKSTKSIENTPSRPIPHDYQKQTPFQTNTSNTDIKEEKKYNHSTDKNISDRQVGLIKKLAAENNQNPDDVSSQRFGKRVQFLNQKEANDIIQYFKNQ